MVRIVTILLLTLAVFTPAKADEAIEGVWRRGDGKAIVQIAPCGGSLCATNTWVSPGAKDEKTGDTLVMKLKRHDDVRLKGTAHDTRRGLTYSLTVKTKGSSMHSEGCVLAGLACRSIGWTRLR